jgi:hypothetical protein
VIGWGAGKIGEDGSEGFTQSIEGWHTFLGTEIPSSMWTIVVVER